MQSVDENGIGMTDITDDLIEYDLLFGTASHNDENDNMHNNNTSSGASHYSHNKLINHKQANSMDDDVLEMQRRIERRVSRDVQRRKDMGIGHTRNDSQLMFDNFRTNNNKARMSEEEDDDSDDMKDESIDQDYLQNKERDSESVGDSDNDNDGKGGKKKGKRRGKKNKNKGKNKSKKNKKEERSGYDTVLKKLDTEKETVMFQGYLDRKTNQSVFGRKLWERRYFKLKTHALSIFVDENGIYPECMFLRLCFLFCHTQRTSTRISHVYISRLLVLFWFVFHNYNIGIIGKLEY